VQPISSSTHRVEVLQTISSYAVEDSSIDDDDSDEFRADELASTAEYGGIQGIKMYEEALDREDYRNDSVFGYSSKSAHSPLRVRAKTRRASHATTS
jgi:hypothetical protein